MRPFNDQVQRLGSQQSTVFNCFQRLENRVNHRQTAREVALHRVCEDRVRDQATETKRTIVSLVDQEGEDREERVERPMDFYAEAFSAVQFLTNRVVQLERVIRMQDESCQQSEQCLRRFSSFPR